MGKYLKNLPDVFDETETDRLNTIKDPKNLQQKPQVDEPVMPKYYDNLSKMNTGKPLSQKFLYSSISQFTPYLVQNLLYISKHPSSSMRDRTQATKILIDKILPNLNADHIKLDSENLQSLVIVKAPKRDS